MARRADWREGLGAVVAPQPDLPAVRWPDGRIDQAKTWQALLERVNALPWNAKMDEAEFRQELARRAWVWNAEVVRPSLGARALFRALERAKMLEILSGAAAE